MSTPSLFRTEVIEFQRSFRRWGNVAELQPPSSKVISWFLVASVGAIIVFLLTAEYSKKETVAGFLSPDKGTAKLFVSQRGTIKEVQVKEGDSVYEGEPLLTIETSQFTSNGSEVNATMLDTLLAQKEELTNNIAAEEDRSGSEQERLTSLIHGLDAEIAELRSQIRIQAERINVAESELLSGEQLKAKGYMTAVEVRRRQVEVLGQRQNLSSLNQQLAARTNQRGETSYSLQQLPTMMAQKIQALRNELAATEQRVAEINGRRAQVIRAPTSGRVATLQARVGQNADPQRLQLEIIPSDGVLQAELFVPTRAIGFVQPGQTVRILYDAFPYQHFGTHRGKIAQVSQTILIGSDVSGPLTLKEPAYRVVADLERADVDAYGKKLPLQPHMLLRADIILDKRSLASWFLDPLLSVRM